MRRWNDESNRKNIEEYNALITDYCVLNNISLIDNYISFYNRLDYYSNDSIHPNREGYVVIAYNFFEKIIISLK